jgi:peptidase E
LGEGEPGASIFPGLSLIDFEIYPHYEDEMLPEIKKHWDGKKLCLLKNGEAITVIDGKTTIFGEERFLESKSY